MHATWMHSGHHDTFFTMHRSEAARDYAKAFGITRIKHNSMCIECHYTPEPGSLGMQALSGVSCESCHGPASEWNLVHSNLTDPLRLEKAEALGMIRPQNTQAMVARCFDCHTVAREDLLNQTYHPSGRGFEVVAWLQGEVRHNFMTESLMNLESPIERRRVLYVVGKATELEYALRGLASATEEGAFTRWMIRRIKSSRGELDDVRDLTEIPEINSILEAVEDLELTRENAPALLEAANTVNGAIRSFAERSNGTELSALDELLPTPDHYIGEAYQP